MESITGAPKSTLSGRGTAHDSEGLLGRRCSDRHPAGWVGGAAIYLCNYYKINNCGRGEQDKPWLTMIRRSGKPLAHRQGEVVGPPGTLGL